MKSMGASLASIPPTTPANSHDPLDAFNVYLVAKVGGEFAGFISITPPTGSGYSIDKYFARESLPLTFDEQLYEIRLLTVLPAYRGGELATLLMYAAFRWIESHGGTRVAAIGREELLELYERCGLERTGMKARCGAVQFELLHATVATLRRRADELSELLGRIERGVDWQLHFPFRKPAPCFHGGAFFGAIGETFDRLERRRDVINADVLDAWFPAVATCAARYRRTLAMAAANVSAHRLRGSDRHNCRCARRQTAEYSAGRWIF